MSDFEASHGGAGVGFAKPLYGLKPYQGFESLPLRHIVDISKNVGLGKIDGSRWHFEALGAHAILRHREASTGLDSAEAFTPAGVT